MYKNKPVSTEIDLGVNIDHVATLRQARGTLYPDPIQAAFEAELAGADGITVHLREDRRHIQDRDIYMLRDTIQTRMNFEMAVTDEMLAIASKIKPHNCCLVPEKREELTTEGGLDVAGNQDRLRAAISQLSDIGIRVSLFVDPDPIQINAVAAVGATVIEIHTGAYAEASTAESKEQELKIIADAVEYATTLDLTVNAGHGLNYVNVKPIAALPYIKELNIGHAIVARALFCGMGRAVSDMKRLMIEGRQN